ncbi:hypothetical protein U1Q18_020780 [Sarracenia purpurea var. burkii]
METSHRSSELPAKDQIGSDPPYPTVLCSKSYLQRPRNFVQNLRRQKNSPAAAVFRPEKRGGRMAVLWSPEMEVLGCLSDAIVNVWQGFGNPSLVVHEDERGDSHLGFTFSWNGNFQEG